MLKHGILGLIGQGDKTGYEINELFKTSLNYFWNANTSQIYRELQNLRDKGFVSDTLVKQQGKPDKKVFNITSEGRNELQEWLKNRDYGNNNNGLLMKMFFSYILPPEENIARLSDLLKSSRENSNRFAEIHCQLENLQGTEGPEKLLFWELTLDFGIRSEQMIQEWTQYWIRKIKESQKTE